MEAFLPPHSPQKPLTNLAPNSPPHHTPFYNDGNAQQAMHLVDNQDPHRAPVDFPRNRGAMTMNGKGALSTPNGPPSHIPNGGGRHRSTVSMGAYEGPRSPPSTKNTSHVPCKFFRLGQCQAGKACPFSHTLDTSNDEVCRYFQKVGISSPKALRRILTRTGKLQIRTKVCPGTYPS